MKKSVSIVEARRDLGRLAEEVRRTGQPVVLTRRGRAVARIAPEPVAEAATAPQRRDGFAALRGTLRMNCSFDALVQAVRELRDEFTQNLERRAGRGGPKRG
jgi:prevent-host-death family protein